MFLLHTNIIVIQRVFNHVKTNDFGDTKSHFIPADTLSVDNVPQDDSLLSHRTVVTWVNKCDYKEKRSNNSLQKRHRFMNMGVASEQNMNERVEW